MPISPEHSVFSSLMSGCTDNRWLSSFQSTSARTKHSDSYIAFFRIQINIFFKYLTMFWKITVSAFFYEAEEKWVVVHLRLRPDESKKASLFYSEILMTVIFKPLPKNESENSFGCQGGRSDTKSDNPADYLIFNVFANLHNLPTIPP